MKCSGYVQTTEKGASLELRDSCLRCGRTLEAHKRDHLTPEMEADEWLMNEGFSRHPLLGVLKGTLARYIRSKKR